MGASGPATWATFAFIEFLTGTADATCPSFDLLSAFDPTDKFVTG